MQEKINKAINAEGKTKMNESYHKQDLTEKIRSAWFKELSYSSLYKNRLSRSEDAAHSKIMDVPDISELPQMYRDFLQEKGPCSLYDNYLAGEIPIMLVSDGRGFNEEDQEIMAPELWIPGNLVNEFGKILIPAFIKGGNLAKFYHLNLRIDRENLPLSLYTEPREKEIGGVHKKKLGIPMNFFSYIAYIKYFDNDEETLERAINSLRKSLENRLLEARLVKSDYFKDVSKIHEYIGSLGNMLGASMHQELKKEREHPHHPHLHLSYNKINPQSYSLLSLILGNKETMKIIESINDLFKKS